MAYNLLEADFHFDLQPLNAKYVSLEVHGAVYQNIGF